MAKLNPLKKPTRTKKPVSRSKKATASKKKPTKKSAPKDRPTIAVRAKSGTFGKYDWDPGDGINKRRRRADELAGGPGGYGAYGDEKGNITYKHLGETVKKTTKSRKKPGPKKR